MYGTTEHLDDGRWRLRFVRTLPHPAEKVWRALTEPAHLAHWFPSTIDGEPAAGAPLRFVLPHEIIEPIEGEMIVYEPPSVLEFRWGTDILRLELRETGGGTELTLLDTLEERGNAARDAAGWHVCLDGLAAHLSGEPSARETMTAWNEVHPHYIATFGPEGAMIGPPAGIG